MQTISSTLDTALAAGTVYPKPKVIMHLSNNANVAATVNASHKQNAESLIDGIYEPSMRFARADGHFSLDDGCRLWPIEENVQIPWIGKQISDESGNFSAPETIEIIYPEDIISNKIIILSDPLSPKGAGQVRLMDVYIRQNDEWILIMKDWNPNTYKAEAYLQSNNGIYWSPNRDASLAGGFTTTFDAIRVVVKAVKTGVVSKWDDRRYFQENRSSLLTSEAQQTKSRNADDIGEIPYLFDRPKQEREQDQTRSRYEFVQQTHKNRRGEIEEISHKEQRKQRHQEMKTELRQEAQKRQRIELLDRRQNIKNYTRKESVVLFEIDAALEVDITEDVISINITKDRDLSDLTLSPLGSSNANTCNLVLANHDNKYNNIHSDSPYIGLLTLNVKFEIYAGFKLPNSSYEYVRQGTFFSDVWTVSQDTTTTTVTCRDMSKVLQESKMDSIFYNGFYLHDIIKDVVERAGILNYDIQISNLSRSELSSGRDTRHIGNEDFLNIEKNNLIWNQEGTYWTFLQSVALADLGVFYFDENGKFIYKSRQSIDDPSSDDFTVRKALTDTDYILSADYTNELMKNSVAINYTVPKLSEHTLGLWTADDSILGATRLTAGVDAASTSFQVSDVADWPKQGYFRVDNEIIKYNERTDRSFDDCVRGQLGTTPADHGSTISTFWNTDTKQEWVQRGEFLEAKGSSNEWGVAVSKQSFSNDISYYGRFQASNSPFQAAILFKTKSLDTYYKFVIKTISEIPALGQGNTDKYKYQLFRVRNGSLSKVATSSEAAQLLSLDPHSFRIDINDNTFKFFVDGFNVLNFTDKSDDRITGGGGIGVSAIGSGPTLFSNIVVLSSAEGSQGEVVLFRGDSGNTIREIRKFTAEYGISPATEIRYIFTNEQEADVIGFEPGPFKSEMYVENQKNGLTQIQGASPEKAFEGITEYFFIIGKAIENLESQRIDREDKKSIKKYGKQELVVDLPWVQSKQHAKKLLDHLIKVYKDPITFVDAEIMALPHLQLGDMVTLTYPRLGYSAAQFHIVSISIDITGEGGFMQTLKLRSRASTTLEGSIGGTACPSVEPASTLVHSRSDLTTGEKYWVDKNDIYSHRLTGSVKETKYDTTNSPVISFDGQQIPITVLQPATSSGFAINLKFPAIIYAHSGYPLNENEKSDFLSKRNWLHKLVKTGYVVVYVDYRGSGGHGTSYFKKRSILHDELHDFRTTKTWMQTLSYVNPNRIALMGLGRGGNIALYMSNNYPDDFKAYISLSGTPNIGCSISKWPDTENSNLIRRKIYKDFGGSPAKNPVEYIDLSPAYNVSDITKPILMVHGGSDNLVSNKTIYGFQKDMDSAGKDLTIFAYKDQPGGFMFSRDGDDKTTPFKSDVWLRTVKWLRQKI